jgi:hypothetical protein
MHLKDGYGTGLDRSQVCFDSTKTVVVMITDTCESCSADSEQPHAAAELSLQHHMLSSAELRFSNQKTTASPNHQYLEGLLGVLVIWSHNDGILAHSANLCLTAAGPCDYPPNQYSNKR